MARGLQAQAHRPRFECSQELVSGSAGLKMSRPFRMTERADPAVAEDDVSRSQLEGSLLSQSSFKTSLARSDNKGWYLGRLNMCMRMEHLRFYDE